MHLFVGLKRTWDRKLSSGWMMSGQLNSALTGLMSTTFMATHLLQFTPRSYVAILLVHFDVLQGLGSEVVFWFVARVRVCSPLPIPLRSY